jgi:hypothetical protein
VRTPDTSDPTYKSRLCVVVGGLPSDPGAGYLLVAPADVERLTVRCSDGAINRGDLLVYDEAAATAGYPRRAKADNTATHYIGRALTAKAVGAAGSSALILTVG